MPLTESAFIAAATAGGAPALLVGPGDDAAVLRDGTVVTVDAFVQGVHFAAGTPLALVVRKAYGASLSDLAAMGARPTALFVCACVPPEADAGVLADELARAADEAGVPLAGGDTSRAPPGALTLAVTATGRCTGPPWLRSGGRPGDVLAVSGPLGGSLDSGRHLRPRPRFDVAERLRAAGDEPHAAMDLSDGLGIDLPRLCAASGAGAVVDAAQVPVHADVAAGRDRLAAALGDGEDFELLLAFPPDVALPAGLLPIGELTAGAALVLRRGGEALPWPGGGYEHVL